MKGLKDLAQRYMAEYSEFDVSLTERFHRSTMPTRWRVERKSRDLFWSYPWRVFMIPPGGYQAWVYLGECRSWEEAMEWVEDLIHAEQVRLNGLTLPNL